MEEEKSRDELLEEEARPEMERFLTELSGKFSIWETRRIVRTALPDFLDRAIWDTTFSYQSRSDHSESAQQPLNK